jgi:hypothetical protein
VEAILRNSSMKRVDQESESSLSSEDKLLLSRLVKIINTPDEQNSARLVKYDTVIRLSNFHCRNTRPRVEVLGTDQFRRDGTS